ncbi:hypothetical protein Bpfe_013875 [Biomphalaria pfeifferi]|uniref:Uncharacterized protein n=1 Tax=Biomphalaria pfeifferi TaxID=112525 RepID=A0AAD8F9G6_BIOPF|nr:hypothetical protein Bpfe_013875 [Biomphalaria pfeifferi]
MASPESFLARSGILPGRKSRVPSVLQEIQMDIVKIKRVSSDTLASPMLRYEKRSNMKPQLVLTSKLANKSEQNDVPGKTSSLSLTESERVLSKQHLDNQTTYGFRYHSNGDERLPTKRSETIDLSRANRYFPKFPSDEKRDMYLDSRIISEYMQNSYSVPKLNRISKNPSNSVIDDFEQCYRDGFRRMSEPILRHLSRLSDERFLNEKGRLHQPFMQLTRNIGYKDNWIYNVKAQHEFHGDSITRRKGNAKGARKGRGTALQPAQSSFNMRYGVSSKLLASRKPTLEDCRMHELEEVSNLKGQIDTYTKSVQDMKRKPNTQDILKIF